LISDVIYVDKVFLFVALKQYFSFSLKKFENMHLKAGSSHNAQNTRLDMAKMNNSVPNNFEDPTMTLNMAKLFGSVFARGS